MAGGVKSHGRDLLPGASRAIESNTWAIIFMIPGPAPQGLLEGVFSNKINHLRA